MRRSEYIQLRAFARQDGAIAGVIWIISFVCFVKNFSNPAMGMLGLALAVSTLVIIPMRVKKYRDSVCGGGVISFRRTMWYTILVFFYAAVLLSISQYIYFAYIDKGYLYEQYTYLMSLPEMKAALTVYGLRQQAEEGLTALREMRPIDFSLNTLTVNITMGIVLSIPLAFILSRKQNKRSNGYISNHTSLQ